MVRVDEDAEIPEAGAVFTFGKSRFAENVPSKFWFRNDVVTCLDCGDEHTLVATVNGRVYAFGTNDWGQLGLGTTRNVSKPTCIKALKHEKVKCVGAGRSHSIVYTEAGRLYTFGANGEGQLGVGDNVDRHEPCAMDGFSAEVRAVAAGSYHSAVLTADGKLFTFGCNNQGQLGLGDGIDKVFAPTQVQIDAPVTYVSCGYYHTAFVANGKLYTFGEKEGGKLGLLDKQLSRGTALPQCIFSIAERVASVSCGGNHTALLTECGKLYTFGSGLNGQLGLGTMVMETGAPSLVGAFDAQTVHDVSCGESHTAIVVGQGRLLTCGDGRHGKLGLGNDNFSNQFNPIALKNFQQYVVHQVSCGGCHMVVLATKRVADDPLLIVDGEDAEVISKPLAPSGTEVSGDGLLMTARGRRREKEIQGKTLLPVGRSLPPLSGNSDSKMENLVNTNEDLERLQRELMETDIPDEAVDSKLSANDGGDAKTLLSEGPQLNKTRVLLPVAGAQQAVISKPTPIKHSSADGKRQLEKQLKAESDDDCKSDSNSSGSSSDGESEIEVAKEKKDGDKDRSNTDEDAKNEATINNHDKEVEVPEKKESFLKKIFTFKKKSASKTKPKVEGATTNETKVIETDAKILQGSPTTAGKTETVEPQILNDVQGKVEVTSGEKVDKQTLETSKSDGNKTTASNGQTSKACNII